MKKNEGICATLSPRINLNDLLASSIFFSVPLLFLPHSLSTVARFFYATSPWDCRVASSAPLNVKFFPHFSPLQETLPRSFSSSPHHCIVRAHLFWRAISTYIYTLIYKYKTTLLVMLTCPFFIVIFFFISFDTRIHRVTIRNISFDFNEE